MESVREATLSLAQGKGVLLSLASTCLSLASTCQRRTVMPMILVSIWHSIQTMILIKKPPLQQWKCASVTSVAVYNRSVKIDFYHCNGALKGVKMCLKCNWCGIYYGYSKYDNSTLGWNLYDSLQIAIESSDVCFVQRGQHLKCTNYRLLLLQWMTETRCLLTNHSRPTFHSTHVNVAFYDQPKFH